MRSGFAEASSSFEAVYAVPIQRLWRLVQLLPMVGNPGMFRQDTQLISIDHIDHIDLQFLPGETVQDWLICWVVFLRISWGGSVQAHGYAAHRQFVTGTLHFYTHKLNTKISMCIMWMLLDAFG